MKSIFVFFTILIFSCNVKKQKNVEAELDSGKEIVLKKYFLKRPSYNLAYYSDWKIDSTDVDFDLDSYFTFNSPSDNNFIVFYIFNTHINSDNHLSAQLNAHLGRTMKNGLVTYINKWGNYEGKGAIIKGKLLGIYKGEIEIFVYSSENRSFLIVSQLMNSDIKQDQPGLKLIESSFRLHQ